MKKTIFLIVGILIVLVLGYQVFDAYLANHTYYRGTATDVGMIGSGANWKILIWSIVFAALPITYLLAFKKKTLKGFAISLFSGLFLYSVAASAVKDALIGPGFLIMLFKYVILFAVISYFIAGLVSTGTWIRHKIFGQHHRSIEQIFLNIGLGLMAFCLINYVLIVLHLFYGIVVAIFFVAYGVCSWMMKKELTHVKTTIEHILNIISWEKVKHSPMFFVYILLILFSLMYIYHGFVLADIPYPTAWDANHAYMYFPKIWALNGGYYWEAGLANNPQIWYTYIAFWFKLMYIFGTNTWISADNLAVIMNFISGVFVLSFGLILVREVIHFIQGNDEHQENIFFIIGWFLLILWLTSGMGAFLVFVDNKTDLGIMALTILALYSGFLFINQLATSGQHKDSMQYAILSGVLFAGAILAKPTATFDVINFTVTLIALWFGGILALGVILGIIGVLGKSSILTAQKFISPALANQMLISGGVLSIIGVVYAWIKKKWQHIRYIIVWAAVIIGTLLIVKGPYLLAKQLKIDHEFKPSQLVKDIFLTQQTEQKKKPILLASTVDYNQLLAADIDISDAAAVATTGATSPMDAALAACKAQNVSTEDLYKDLKTPPGSALNEDVGRYVGYGWRSFTNPWWGFVIGNGCHGKKDAKILCENQGILEAPTHSGLQMIHDMLPDESEAKSMIGEALLLDPTALATSEIMLNIKSYYQDGSWAKQNGVVSLPYIALVPFNITFNWSLQNLTSYYTDIGVIWLICLFIVILGFVYSLVQWNKKLFAVTLSALCGWTIWWIAGGAILWYSLGVVIWTIIATILVLYTFGQRNNALQKNLFSAIILILALIGIYQLFLNFIRISSQGGGGPFVWYKANVGNKMKFDNNLQQQTVQKIGYNDKDVFELQFGSYTPIINILDQRGEDEGVIVAGTYLSYFLRNQHRLESDGFLVSFRKNLSDNNPCNTYLRLRDQKIGYIVIDPNIASVVMGDANSTLRDRIFGKFDATNSKVVDYGSMTMIAKMINDGYMSLASTNIISAKYAFTLSYEELKAAYPNVQEEEFVLRTKLATLRFWGNAQELFNGIPAIFNQRMINGEAVSDVATVLGKDVDITKIRGIASSVLSQKKLNVDVIAPLNEDERTVLVQYLSLYNMMKTNPQQYQQVMISLLQQSVLGNSQIMLFKLN